MPPTTNYLEGHHLEFLIAEITKRVVDHIEERLAEVADPPQTYTAEQACERLAVSRNTLMLWISEGRLHRVPHINKVLIPRESIERFAASAFHS